MNTYNFIEKYKVSSSICDNFIQYHKDNTEYKSIGRVDAGKISKNIKDSIDVYFYNGSQNPFILKFFEELNKASREYTHKYDITNYFKADPLHIVQYYKPGQGYFKRHYERSSLDLCRRQVVYMLYCNDLKNGGTEFPFQIIGHPQSSIKDYNFTPKSVIEESKPKFENKTSYGIDLRKVKVEKKINLKYLIDFYNDLKKIDNSFFGKYFFRIAGNKTLENQIISGLSENEIRASWKEKIDSYKVIRKKYLLYKDFE